MVSYSIEYTKQAVKDIELLKAAGLAEKAKRLVEIIKLDPFNRYPPYEKLVGDLSGAYSRRINIHHRLVYMVFEEEKIIRILRMWTHYE